MSISATEVKQNGVLIFERMLDKFSEVVITVRGKKKYVAIDYERYKKLREYELDSAYQDAMEDIANRDYIVDSNSNRTKLSLGEGSHNEVY